MKGSLNKPAMFLTINDIAELREYLNTNRAVILYFSQEHCSVCKALKPKLNEALNGSYPDIKNVLIDTKLSPLLAAEYQVNTVPVVLLYLEGREFFGKPGPLV
jgi:thioredoxin 1